MKTKGETLSKLERVCVIHPDNGEIEFNGSSITLRPKTFELLLLLSSRPGQVISKAKILEAVWSESVVEDQVVFQSINEIRKEFGETDIIKTYPRRGYAWNHPDTQIRGQAESDTQSFLTSNTFKYVASTASILLMVFAIFFASQAPKSQNTEAANQELAVASHQGILILPFDVEALQEPEKWIRFGALQGLISKIRPHDAVTVFQLEDTLEILNRLSILEKSDISNLFKKSGASLILETSISGVPGDYHFVYSMYTPNTVETKSIHVKTINDGVNTLAALFDNGLTSSTSFDAEFRNSQLQQSLIAKAIQFLEVNDHHSALAFLKSAMVADKTNIYVHYLVAKVASRLGDIDQALDSTQTALKLLNNGNKKQYRNRLLYLHGSLLLSKGKVDLAEEILFEAEVALKASKDWLYYSYTQSMLGKMRQIQGEFDAAKNYFADALEYQELLQCPMGIAQGHLSLAELYLAQNQTDKAIESFQLAESLIKEQRLQQAEPVLAYVKGKFEGL